MAQPALPIPRDAPSPPSPFCTLATPTSLSEDRGGLAGGWVGRRADASRDAPIPPSLHLARIGSATQDWGFGTDSFF